MRPRMGYLDMETMNIVTTQMYIDGYQVKLVSDTRYGTKASVDAGRYQEYRIMQDVGKMWIYKRRNDQTGEMVNTWCDYYVYGILASDI